MSRDKIQNNKLKRLSIECHKCKNDYEEDEMDLIDGDYICKNCKVEMGLR